MDLCIQRTIPERWLRGQTDTPCFCGVLFLRAVVVEKQRILLSCKLLIPVNDFKNRYDFKVHRVSDWFITPFRSDPLIKLRIVCDPVRLPLGFHTKNLWWPPYDSENNPFSKRKRRKQEYRIRVISLLPIGNF